MTRLTRVVLRSICRGGHVLRRRFARRVPRPYVFSVIPDCRVARSRAVAWPCMVTWGSKHGHATAHDRATHAKHVHAAASTPP